MRPVIHSDQLPVPIPRASSTLDEEERDFTSFQSDEDLHLHRKLTMIQNLKFLDVQQSTILFHGVHLITSFEI